MNIKYYQEMQEFIQNKEMIMFQFHLQNPRMY